MTRIIYNHKKNIHLKKSPDLLLPIIFSGHSFKSLLDVGAGNGIWIKSAQKLGVNNVLGIDGIKLPEVELQCSSNNLIKIDLNNGFNLNSRYDVVLCLEVAEHLSSDSAHLLVKSLTNHSDHIFFSAAIPGQNGQNHINCQWPDYWQLLFNKFGFECKDEIRSKIWNLDVEPWYKQNIFYAFKSNNAGNESRILPIVHPEMLKYISINRYKNYSPLRKFLSNLRKVF